MQAGKWTTVKEVHAVVMLNIVWILWSYLQEGIHGLELDRNRRHAQCVGMRWEYSVKRVSVV